MEVGNTFRTIDQKLDDEVKYNLPDLIHTRKQKEKLRKEQEDVYLVPNEQMGFAIAHCIYNEEQHFEEVLMDDLRMCDVDYIHILDGAWEKFEDGEPLSNKETRDIIHRFALKASDIGITVTYECHPEKKLWDNQGTKRSYQLDRIREHYGNTRHYILTKDGDELFHFMSGRQCIWLKRDFVKWFDLPINIGLLNAHSYYGELDMWGARLFPSNRKLHYFTGRSMVIHDEDHNIVMDYNPETLKVNNDICFKFNSFMLINQWTTRPQVRINQKKSYIKYRLEERFADKPCTYV